MESIVLAAAPMQLPTWSLSGSVETAFGYDDNLLLSHAEEERSAFVQSRAEMLLFNLPQGRFDYSMLAEATGTRFFSGRSVNHEAGAWINLEPGYRVSDAVKLSLPLTGYYSDRVWDVSDTDVERRIAAWKVIGGFVSPTVRWNFHRAWWIEVQPTLDRRTYDDHSQDSRMGAGEARLSWQPIRQVELRLTGARRWRSFDTRVQYNAAGRELPDTQLKVAEREGELRIDVSWDEAKHWNTSTRATLLYYRDNGSGFFDYHEKGISQELEWKRDPWLVRLEGEAGRLDFDLQTVGFGLAPPPLVKDQYAARFRVERMVSRRWTAFGGYTWERRRSNDRIQSYRVNEGLLGLRWSWEKP